MNPRRQSRWIVRYAVVGLGHIAQDAVLPAFAHAGRNSRLVALVSGDARKRRELARRHDATAYDYDEYDSLLASGVVDAVYLALPNDRHRDFAVRAARRGVHVLCEKPLAVTAREAEAMVRACRRHGVRLMTAYRLHLEPATRHAMDLVRAGRIGEPRLFTSTFTMRVKDAGNIRMRDWDAGGGPLHDIGIYCINAARNLFDAEPVEVAAFATAPVRGAAPASVVAHLRFPRERLASFAVSFDAADVSEYRIVGTGGSILAEPAYEYAEGLSLVVRRGSRVRRRHWPKSDQFAPELLHFSDCIVAGRDPQPSGEEGVADLRVIEALHRAARTGRRVRLAAAPKRRPARPVAPIVRPAIPRPPRLVNATPPSA